MLFLQRNDNGEKYYCIFNYNHKNISLNEVMNYLNDHNINSYICYVYINNGIYPVIKLSLYNDIQAITCFSLLKNKYHIQMKEWNK